MKSVLAVSLVFLVALGFSMRALAMEITLDRDAARALPAIFADAKFQSKLEETRKKVSDPLSLAIRSRV